MSESHPRRPGAWRHLATFGLACCTRGLAQTAVASFYPAAAQPRALRASRRRAAAAHRRPARRGRPGRPRRCTTPSCSTCRWTASRVPDRLPHHAAAGRRGACAGGRHPRLGPAARGDPRAADAPRPGAARPGLRRGGDRPGRHAPLGAVRARQRRRRGGRRHVHRRHRHRGLRARLRGRGRRAAPARRLQRRAAPAADDAALPATRAARRGA